MPYFGRAALLFLVLAPACAALAASCTIVHHGGSGGGSATSGGGAGGATTATTTGSSTGGSTGSGGEAPATGRGIFEATVQAQIVAECGTCHNLGGISESPFLALPDVYASIASWPGVLVANPDTSVLITHPADPSHGAGQAPNMTAALKAKVMPWLEFEAAHLPMPDGGALPILQPQKPFLQGAFNAIYLDALGDAYKNSAITFNAEELGSPPSMLLISNLEVHVIAGVSLHLVHPLFTAYPAAGGELPDPVDSFSGYDGSFTLDSDPTLGTGTLVLNGWSKDARLGIAFEKTESTTMSGTVSTCKDVATFQSVVVPQIKMWGCASNCHGGAKIEAQQQMDLSNLDAMPPDEACSQVRARIKPTDVDNSEIFIVTDPTKGAVHLFKFAGNKNNFNTFKTAVTPWIMAEQ